MSSAERRWDTEDVERRLCHILSLAEQVIALLASHGYTDGTNPNNQALRPEKVIAETALLLWVASQVNDRPAVDARVRHVARELAPFARSEHMLMHVCLDPANTLDYAQAHIVLSQLGLFDGEFDASVTRSLQSQAAQGRERPPHRMLERLWFSDLHASPSQAAMRRGDKIAAQTVLFHPVDLLRGSRDDIYAFTHALMYTSRFCPPSLRWPRPASDIRAEASCLLARCMDEQDYDLCGELLLAWPLTRGRWNASATFAFHVLARVEDAAGFLPAPTTRLDKLSTLTGVERKTYLLATAYHTIYVMGLLCASILGMKRLPPVRVPSHSAIPGAANCVLELMSACETSPHWVESFAQLRTRERDALAPLLLDMGLFRCVKQQDFHHLHQLLMLGQRLGLAASPAASQAAELLGRMADFSRITHCRRERTTATVAG